MRKLFANPYLLLTLTVLSWSGNMVIGRGIRGDIPPLTLAFWRWVIAFLLVLPLALPHLKTQWPLLKKGWKPLLVLGLLGVGGYNTFAYLALQHTSATNATLLTPSSRSPPSPFPGPSSASTCDAPRPSASSSRCAGR